MSGHRGGLAGWEYMYLDANNDIREDSVVNMDIRDTNSPLYNTFVQLSARQQAGTDPYWLAYTDQQKLEWALGRPLKRIRKAIKDSWGSLGVNFHSTGGSMAHAKGTVGYDSTSTRGFHIVHSCPGFPLSSGPNPYDINIPTAATWGTAGWLRCNQNGQQFGCYNLGSNAALTGVMDDLAFSNVFVFRTNADLTNIPPLMQPIVDPNYARSLAYKNACSGGGLCERPRNFRFGQLDFTFVPQASNTRRNTDIFIVTGNLAGNDTYVQTWRRTSSANLGPKMPPASTYRILDAATQGPAFGYRSTNGYWETSHDHAKLSWTKPTATNPFSCHGGLNREQKQLERGGSVLCVNSYSVATLLNRMQRSYNTNKAKKINAPQAAIGASVTMASTTQYNGADLDRYYPTEARDLDPVINGNEHLGRYIVPLPLLADTVGNPVQKQIQIWSSTSNLYYVLPLLNDRMAVCACNVPTDRCTYANAIRIAPTGNNAIFALNQNYELFRYLARLVDAVYEETAALVAAQTVPEPNFLGVCVTPNAAYSMEQNVDSGLMQLVVPRVTDDISATPIYSRMDGTQGWCYDCVAQQFGRWVMHTANPLFYLPSNDQVEYEEIEGVVGGALYFGLSWSLGLGFRYFPTTVITDSPNDPTNARLRLIEVETGEVNGDYRLERRHSFGLGTRWRYAAHVAQCVWDFMDPRNERSPTFGVDPNNGHQISLTALYEIIADYGGMISTVPAQDFLETVAGDPQFDSVTQGMSEQILIFNQIFPEDYFGEEKKRTHVVREDPEIPSYDQLRSLLISDYLDPNLVNSFDMQALYNDALIFWFFPNSAVNWNTNRALVTIVEQLNINREFSVLQLAAVSVPTVLDAILNFNYSNTNVPTLVDPADIVTLSNTFITLAQYAQETQTFTEDLEYLFWPLSKEARRKSTSSAPDQGLYIVMYDDLLCGFGTTTASAFATLQPTSADCPSGPIISNVQPLNGPAAGGIPITISGFNFDTVQSATIGGNDCPITATADNQITCTLPVGVSNTNTIVLTNALGENLPDRWNFIYDKPVLDSMAPSTPVVSGSVVTIFGANFGPTSVPVDQISVTVGGTPCVSFTHESDSQITCTIPDGFGQGNLVYVVVAGQGSDATELYIDYAEPFVSSISPTSGPAAGGLLTISGSNFQSDASLMRVRVGGLDADIMNSSPSQVVVLLPPMVGADLDVVVSVDGKDSTAPMTYSVDAPVIEPPITDLDTAGGFIDIHGVNFGGGEYVNYLTLEVGSDSTSPVISALETNDTTLYAYVPPGIGVNIPVTINVSNQVSTPVEFSYAPPYLFTYYLIENISTDGGQNVYIIGDNLVPGGVLAGDYSYSNVTINGTICPTNESSWIDPQEVDCILPKGIGANNTLCIAVGSQPALECLFISYPAPQITSFYPVNGSAGSVITIFGTNFVPEDVSPGDSNAYVDGTACNATTWINASAVACVLPPGYGTDLCIVVKVGNQFSVPECSFNYNGPIITDVVNKTINTRGGEVFIYGENFGNGSITPVVHFAGSDIPTTWLNGTVLQATIPPGTGTNKTISVSVGSQTSPEVTYFSYEAPTISSIEPRNSNTTGHIDVIVRGSNYGPGTPAPEILFGGAEFPIKTWVSHEEVIFTVPEGEGRNITIQVVVDGQYSNTNTEFNYDAPIIDDVQPREYSTAGGVTLSITGSNFGAGSPLPEVKFNNQVVASDRKSHYLIEITLPKGIGRQIPIVVTVDGEVSAENKLFSYSRPVITSSSLSTGTDGGVITISGQNFVPQGVSPGSNSNITVDGNACTSPEWTSDTSVKCTVRAGTGKNKEVIVSVGGQSSDGKNIFSYNGPEVNSINPNKGTTKGGTVVTINGANFGPGSPSPTVTIGGSTCTDVTRNSDSKLTCKTPMGTGKDKSVVVKVDGQSNSANELWSYNAPKIDEVSPSSGSNKKSSVTTLTGTDLGSSWDEADGKLSVTLGGERCTIINAISTEVTITVPIPEPPKVGEVEIVLTLDGQSGTAMFNYEEEQSSEEGSEEDEDDDGDEGGEGGDDGVDGIPGGADTIGLALGGGAVAVGFDLITDGLVLGGLLLGGVVGGLGGGAALGLALSAADGTSSTSTTTEFTTTVGVSTASSSSTFTSATDGGTGTGGTTSFTTSSGGTTGTVTTTTGGGNTGGVNATYNLPFLPVICMVPNDDQTLPLEVLALFCPYPIDLPSPPPPNVEISPIESVASKLLECNGVAPPTPNSGTIWAGCGMQSCYCDHWHWDPTLFSCRCQTSTGVGCSTGNQSITVPFCGTIEYSALYVNFLSPGNEPTMASPYDADQLAEATFNALLPSMNTDACPDPAVLKNLVCSSAFPRMITGLALPICKSVAVNALNCFRNNDPPTFNGTCVDPASCSYYDLITATQLLPVADCTDMTQLVPVVTASTRVSTVGGTTTITGSGFGTNPDVLQVALNGQDMPSFTLESQTTITAEAPPGVGGRLPITIVVGLQSSGPSYVFYYELPEITEFSPTSTNTSEITGVIVTGRNFGTVNRPPYVMRIGDYFYYTYWVNNTCMVIAVSEGIGANLPVYAIIGNQISLPAPATFSFNPPYLQELDPSSGGSDGGTLVTILGFNFIPAGLNYNVTNTINSVLIGSAECTDVTWNDTIVTCITPPGYGIADVTVIVGNQTSTNFLPFTYISGFTGLTPASGPTSGGTLVELVGSGFGTIASYISVTFGGSQSTDVSIVSANTEITCITPPGIGSVSVEVYVDGVQASSSQTFDYDAPSILQIQPSSGGSNGGTLITILGENFVPAGYDLTETTTTNEVWIGSSECADVVWNTTTIVCTTPPGIGEVNVSVIVGSQTSANALPFTYTPVVNSVAPTSGPTIGGTLVTIEGTGLGSVASAISVTFGGAVCTSITVVTANTEITCLSPPGIAHVTIEVSVNGVPADFDQTFYYDVPTLQSLLPTYGGNGTLLTIVGNNFVPAGFDIAASSTTNIVLIGSNECTGVTWNSTVITCTAPPGAGVVNVSVIVGSQPSTNVLSFTYIPIVNSLTPDSGPTSGGTLVTIAGAEFGSVASAITVTFGTAQCTDVTILTPNAITCLSPPGIHFVAVQVSLNGVLADFNQNFYYDVPTLQSLQPSYGVNGTLLTIIGTNFVPTGYNLAGTTTVNKVMVGLLECKNVVWTSTTSITCTIPVGYGSESVSVEVGSQQSTNTLKFTYLPVIASVSPTSGPTSGGTVVVFQGQGFGTVADVADVSVTFGGVPCENITIVTFNTVMKCVTPPGIGEVPVVVSMKGFPAVSQPTFTYNAPTLQLLQPSSGGDGTVLTITGTNFVPVGVSTSTTVNKVFVGSAECIGVVWVNATTIICTTPAGSGVANVSVTVGGQSSTNRLPFTYTPVVNSLNPSSGPTSGGTLVTIAGAEFGSGTSEISVTFGTALCTDISIISTNAITCHSPPGIGSVAVQVSVDGVPANFHQNFNYNAPTLQSLQPSSGVNGSILTIIGTNFVPTGFNLASTTTTNKVMVGLLECKNVVWVSSASITCTIPAGYSSETVSVEVGSQISTNTLTFTYIPVVTSLSPTSGPTRGDTEVLIQGRGFGTVADVSDVSVTFGGVPCANLTIITFNTAMKCVTPPGIGQVAVRVSMKGFPAVSQPTFTYNAPTLQSLRPTSGSAGTILTITGTNFVPTGYNTATTVNKVFVGSAECTGVVWVNTTVITCTVPAGTGNADVSVTVGSQPSTNKLTFTYAQVVAIAPNSGPTNGGTTVTIQGSGFGSQASAVSVKFGTWTCTNVLIVTANTKISCHSPPGVGFPVVKVFVNGVQNSFSQIFYYNAPTVSSISPAQIFSNTTVITLQGTNFVPSGVTPGNSTVTLGGAPGTSITWVSPTQMTFVAPFGTGTMYIALTIGGQIVYASTNINTTYYGYGYVGCFTDSYPRDLPGNSDMYYSNQTIQFCMHLCASQYYRFAGVQFGTQCFCGNSYGRYGTSTDCTYACTGDSSQTCGGYWANSVYLAASNVLKSIDLGDIFLGDDHNVMVSLSASGVAVMNSNTGFLCTLHNNVPTWCSPVLSTATYHHFYADVSDMGLCIYGQEYAGATNAFAVWCALGFSFRSTASYIFAMILDDGNLCLVEGEQYLNSPNPPCIWSSANVSTNITSVSPTTIPQESQTVITITGDNLPSDPTILVGGRTSPRVTVVSPNQINFVAPAGRGTQPITIITQGKSTTLDLYKITYLSEGYIGCYSDSLPRDLNLSLFENVNYNNMTTQGCQSLCAINRYKYTAVQFSYQCFCGNKYGTYGTSTQCTSTCSGASGQICGGVWANSVYLSAQDTLTNTSQLFVQESLMSAPGNAFAQLYPNGQICTIGDIPNANYWCSPLPSTSYPFYYATMTTRGLCVFGQTNLADAGTAVYCTFATDNPNSYYFALMFDFGYIGIVDGMQYLGNPNPPVVWASPVSLPL